MTLIPDIDIDSLERGIARNKTYFDTIASDQGALLRTYCDTMLDILEAETDTLKDTLEQLAEQHDEFTKSLLTPLRGKPHLENRLARFCNNCAYRNRLTGLTHALSEDYLLILEQLHSAYLAYAEIEGKDRDQNFLQQTNTRIRLDELLKHHTGEEFSTIPDNHILFFDDFRSFTYERNHVENECRLEEVEKHLKAEKLALINAIKSCRTGEDRESMLAELRSAATPRPLLPIATDRQDTMREAITRTVPLFAIISNALFEENQARIDHWNTIKGLPDPLHHLFTMIEHCVASTLLRITGVNPIPQWRKKARMNGYNGPFKF